MTSPFDPDMSGLAPPTSPTPNPAIHTPPPAPQPSLPYTPQQLMELGAQWIGGFVHQVALAILGVIPGGAQAFELLSSWANSLMTGFGNIASLFSLNLGDILGDGDGDLDFDDIWATVVNVFIKPIQAFVELVGGFISGALIPILDPTKILNLPALFSDVSAGFANLFNGWFGGSTAVGEPIEVTYVIESVKHAVINGYDVETFTANDTWTVPANLVECHFICVGGGGRGGDGQAFIGNTSTSWPVTVTGGAGGLDGGYRAERINPALLTAGDTVTVTIGMGATTPGASGGVTTIGSTSSVAGVSSVSSPTGYLESSSKPGSGGRGGSVTMSSATVVSRVLPGADGQSSALGSAGAGSTGAGGNGQTVSLTPDTKSGGGGGGGGGGAAGIGAGATAVAFGGGAGGYPGGGSGGGGPAICGSNFGTTAVAGAGGGTPNGCAFIIYKTA